MPDDAIIDEIHAIREEIAKRSNYDIHAIAEAMRKASADAGRKVVSRSPRPVSGPQERRKGG